MNASNNKLPFELSLQRAIIQGMLNNEVFLLRCLSYLKTDYFDNQYLSWLYQKIQDFYNRYKTLPSPETIKTEILKFDIKDRIAYEKVFEDVISNNYKDTQYLYHELTAFARRAYFLEQIKRIEDLYNRGNRQNAYDLTKEVGEAFAGIDFEQEDSFNYNTLMPLLESLKDPLSRIPLGIKPIDEALLGGLPRGSLCMFMGGTNIGKSMILVNVARHMIQHDKKVLFLNLENRLDDTMTRFVSSMTSIPLDKFAFEDITDEDRIGIIMAKEVMQKNLIVKHWYDSNLTIDKVENYCKLKHSLNPYDVLVVDYAQMIRHRASDKWEQQRVQTEVIIALELLARTLNIAIVTAVQVNRAGYARSLKSKGMDLLRLTDVGESYGNMKNADFVITATQSDTDAKSHVIRFLLDKARSSQKGLAVECQENYRCAQIFTSDLRWRRLEYEDNRASQPVDDATQMINEATNGTPF